MTKNNHLAFNPYPDPYFVNCCAHHSRLSNRVFPVKPMMPMRMPKTHGLRISRSVNKHFIRNSAMWCIGCTLFRQGNTFVADFKQLLSKYPSVRTRLLGFFLIIGNKSLCGDKIIALFLKKHWGKPAPSLIVSNKWIVSSP